MEEEIELRIFDYLEGNLSEAEAAEVQQLIETHQDWSRAFRLMKRTYLDPEMLSAGEQEFPNKERLYRRERRPRVFALYYGAAASVMLCGLAYLLWKPADNGSAKKQVTTQQPLASTLRKAPTQQVTQNRNRGRKEPQWPSVHPAISLESRPNEEVQVVENPDEENVISIPLNARLLGALPSFGYTPSSAAPLRFINGTYIPVQQRRSLLRFRMLEEGRELLAWVSEPKLMLVRTRREGARDRMELRLETKKMGIIATLTD